VKKRASQPPGATETHRLDLGEAGSAAVKITFTANEIIAAVDAPSGLNRQRRRLVQLWTRRIFKKLNSDERGMRIVGTSNGKAVSIGAEFRGKGFVIYP
jgi:hypothetical protein